MRDEPELPPEDKLPEDDLHEGIRPEDALPEDDIAPEEDIVEDMSDDDGVDEDVTVSETDDIHETDDVHEADSVEDAEEEVESVEVEIIPPSHHYESEPSGVGAKTVIGVSALATLLGALGGAALSYWGLPHVEPVDTAAIERDISTLQQGQTQLKSQLGNIEPTSGQVSRDALSTLELRIRALESAPSSGPNVNAEFADRLDALEIRPLSQDTGTSEEVATLRARVATLETEISKLLSRPVPVLPSVTLPDFPEFALRQKLREIDAQDKNWIQRILSQHVSVKQPGERDPVDLISDAINRNDISEAVRIIETLPSSARSVAKPWLDVATAQIRFQETVR